MWQLLRKKTEMPTADRALPGRAQPAFALPAEHFVNGNRLQPPFPAGLEQAMFGLGCFWESHDPTQGMRQGSDVGTQYRSGIYTFSAAQKAKAEASRTLFERALANKGYGAVTTEVLDVAKFFMPRTITSSISLRTPTAIAAWAAPA